MGENLVDHYEKASRSSKLYVTLLRFVERTYAHVNFRSHQTKFDTKLRSPTSTRRTVARLFKTVAKEEPNTNDLRTFSMVTTTVDSRESRNSIFPTNKTGQLNRVLSACCFKNSIHLSFSCTSRFNPYLDHSLQQFWLPDQLGSSVVVEQRTLDSFL